jgi:hyperosmotically inducible periplasmic protein
MNGRCSWVAMTAALVCVLTVGGCTKPEDRVHESWVAPPPGEAIDDNALAGTIRSSILADPDIKDLDVKVETDNGEVMLSGYVDNQAQMDRIILFAWTAEGTTKVDNKMSVRTAGTASADL